jgi:hypothetical protein
MIARRILESHGVSVPGQVSMAAVGCTTSGAGEAPCTGWFVTARQVAETVGQILRDTQSRRPATIWLTGKFVDAGTTTIRAAAPSEMPALVGAGTN